MPVILILVGDVALVFVLVLTAGYWGLSSEALGLAVICTLLGKAAVLWGLGRYLRRIWRNDPATREDTHGGVAMAAIQSVMIGSSFGFAYAVVFLVITLLLSCLPFAWGLGVLRRKKAVPG